MICTCLHSSSLAAARQRYSEEADQELQQIAQDQTEVPFTASTACSAWASSSLGGASSAWELSISSCSKGASLAAMGVEASAERSDDPQWSRRLAEIQNGLVHCAGATDGPELQRDKALIEQRGTQRAPLELAERSAAEFLAEIPEQASSQEAPIDVGIMTVQEEEFGGQSPFGTTQLSETSTVVAMSPSDPQLNCKRQGGVHQDSQLDNYRYNWRARTLAHASAN